MPSPFPGMDPYLEPHWLDVHGSLVMSARDALNQQLPADLVASSEERVAVEGPEEDRIYGPDVRIFEPSPDSPVVEESAIETGTITLPYRVLAQVDPIIERFIKIVDVSKQRIVTVIEFISPTNKRGEGMYTFKAKRGELLAEGVRFVEIDLVRAGDWEKLLSPHRADKAKSLYRATIRLPREPNAVYIQPIHLSDRLPVLPIPLRKNDPETRLDLQPLIDHAYDGGRYAIRIDYRRDPLPPLDPENAARADQLLRAAKRR